MPAELLRRGDLALVRSSSNPVAGLYRGEGDGLRPAGALDAGEWWWVLHCAAPLAVRACPREDGWPASDGPVRVVGDGEAR